MRTSENLISRDCLKSSWRTLCGGSSVVPNAHTGLLRAVSCAWQTTSLESIRTFQAGSQACWVDKERSREAGTNTLRPLHSRQPLTTEEH